MASSSFFKGFIFLLVHLGCFFFFFSSSSSSSSSSATTTNLLQHPPKKRRKISPSSPPLPSSKSLSFSNIRSYLNCIFSSTKSPTSVQRNVASDPRTSPADSNVQPHTAAEEKPHAMAAAAGSGSGTKHSSFASRKDIHPCPACGEVLSKPHLLDLHQATKHSLSELSGADSSYNILRIIFQAGWGAGRPPVVHRVLKIHNAPRTLARFEEYRDMVRSKAALRHATRHGGADAGAALERCMADGNERLRFYCSTSLCSLRPADQGVCGSQYCSACGIVRHGFAGKHAELDGIATHSTAWGAHASLPEELEREFAFLQVRRAMVVCRVVAGRIGHGAELQEEEEEEGARGKVAAYDSVVPGTSVFGRGGCGGGEEELVVFNPRAVLPCFIIVYSGSSST